MTLPSARLYLEEHAIFSVPTYNAQSLSASSSEVQAENVIEVGGAPGLAFLDEDKAWRFINALDAALGDTPLQARPSGNDGFTDEEVLAIYEKLFSPGIEEADGLRHPHWEEICNEYDCNLLTFSALLCGVRSVAWRMFGYSLAIKAEPYHPGYHGDHPLSDSKERVDFQIKNADNNTLLFLVEGKNPNVFNTLKSHLSEGFLPINLGINTGTGRKVLNKCIYYMLLYGKDRMVITCFQEAIILELHRVTSGIYLSYSGVIDNDMSSDLFRALLGLILVELRHNTPFEPFSIDEELARLQEASSRTRLRTRPTRPPNYRGTGSVSGSSSTAGSSSGSRSGRASGSRSGRKRNASPDSVTRSQRPFDRTRDVRSDSGQQSAEMVSMIMGSLSNATISSEPQELALKEKNSVVYFYNFPHSNRFIRGFTEFECDPGSPFSSFSTSNQIPRFTVLNKIAEGTVGSVYEIKLRNSDNCNQVSYAIKVIDASRENHDQYWNCYEHLKKEYIAYYLLTLGKEKEKEARSVIQNFTPSCYGLYRPKDKSMDVFVLIIELAGSVSLRLFKLWSATERQMVLQSALCLHTIGLYHGDLEERNVAYWRNEEDSEDSEDYYKIFDFGNSTWHRCSGMKCCEELRCLMRILFPDSEGVSIDVDDFTEKLRRKYTPNYLNLADIFSDDVSMAKKGPIYSRLDQLDNAYKETFRGRKMLLHT